jgi:quercetin dioxygenase-like cupin family protein
MALAARTGIAAILGADFRIFRPAAVPALRHPNPNFRMMACPGNCQGIAAEFRLSYRAATCPETPGSPGEKAKTGRIVEETSMEIHPCGSSPSRRGAAESFTGVVWQDPIIEAPAPARIRSGIVRFEPGARTAWHTHPLGQTLAILSGIGRVQTWGGPVREVRAGDVVWIPPNEKHWHGASPNMLMVHVAMQEALDGKHVAWMEHVSDEQYRAALG